VLAVHDAEVDPALLAQPGQEFLQRAPAGRTEDVRDEEELQGSASWAPGLGLTTIETWLPASRVYRASASRSTPERSTTLPIFDRDAASEDPTVRLGSGWTGATETTIDGAFVGWTAMRTPKTRPL